MAKHLLENPSAYASLALALRMPCKADYYWAVGGGWGGSTSFWPWIPEPRDIGIQTLPLIVWPAGVGRLAA